MRNARTTRCLLLLLVVIVAGAPVWVVDVSVGSVRAVPRTWLRGESTVVVTYLHSVERTWVEERYAADRDGLRLTRMRWQSSGAGLPAEYDAYADGYYVKELDTDIGRTLDYWFLPLNRIEVSIDGITVVRGHAAPARVVVRVCRAPLAVAVFDAARG